jgi:hypothetical protein
VELLEITTESEKLTVCPLGDIQYAGRHGATALACLRRHIDWCLSMPNPWFIGMGDYIDFCSPSNRERLKKAMMYDTAEEVIEAAAGRLVDQVYDVLKATTGRWLGLLEGHHFFEFGGRTSDMLLADKLKTKMLGTSAYVRLMPAGITLLATHGNGGGILPGSPANKLYHWATGLQGADVYLMGHNTKESGNRLSRPRPRWNRKRPDLTHSDILLVNTGGFSRSNIPGHRRGSIVRGDYAEQGMMTPSPLTAPLVHIDGSSKYAEQRVRVTI